MTEANENENLETLVQQALQDGNAATWRASDGSTLLHRACTQKQPELVRKLLAAGVDPNARDGQLRTPLHCVAEALDVESAKALVAGGARGGLLDREVLAPHEMLGDVRSLKPSDPKRKLRGVLEEAGTKRRPQVLVYLPKEHWALPYFLQFAPEAAAVGERPAWFVEKDEGTEDIFKVLKETSPEVPMGLRVAFELSETLCSSDPLRERIIGPSAYGRGYQLRVGYHSDATYREVLDFYRRTHDTFTWEEAVFVWGRVAKKRTEEETLGLLATEPGLQTVLQAVRDKSTMPTLTREEVALLDVVATDPRSFNAIEEQMLEGFARTGQWHAADSLAQTWNTLVDLHALQRERLQSLGATPEDLFSAATRSARFQARFTSREVWAVTQLCNTELCESVFRKDGLPQEPIVRLIELAVRWMRRFGRSRPLAEALWERIAADLEPEVVVRLFLANRDVYRSWAMRAVERMEAAGYTEKTQKLRDEVFD